MFVVCYICSNYCMLLLLLLLLYCIVAQCMVNTVMLNCVIGNFCGVQIFVDFVGLHIPNFIYVLDYMPQKYKLTKLSKFPKPHKLNP